MEGRYFVCIKLILNSYLVRLVFLDIYYTDQVEIMKKIHNTMFLRYRFAI